MKINLLTPYSYKNQIYKSNNNQSNFKSAQPTTKELDLNNMPQNISFKSKPKCDYEKAKAYLDARMEIMKEQNITPNIWAFDIDKLEGIQKGIKVFEGMSMKEISFLLSTLTEVATLRGCYNNCAHCYGEAKPPLKETQNHISRMDWEDFSSLADGMEKLFCRLGFKIKPFYDHVNYITLFHDSDCSQVYIKDKDGKTHDWEEMARRMYDVTGVQQLFDTGGWYLQDKEAQKRVEKYVKNISENDDNDFLYKFNVSINPFHAMYFKSVNAMWDGDKEKEMFFRKKDAQRMANVLFTVSPIANIGKLYLIARALSPDSVNVDGLTSYDLEDTYDRYYLRALKKLYNEDLNGEQKVIKKTNDIKYFINKYKNLIHKDMSIEPTITNKLKDLFDEDDFNVKRTNKFLCNDPQKATEKYALFSIIDANGDVYCTNFVETFKTDLKLNFKNKDKKTAPIRPNLNEKPFTKELINSTYDRWYDRFEPEA